MRLVASKDALVRGRPRGFQIELSGEEVAALERMVRSTTGSAGRARRAGMILLLARGWSENATAARCGVDDGAVRRWGRRFAEERLSGLDDRPRSGRPRLFSP
jgi:hypothetical protein